MTTTTTTALMKTRRNMRDLKSAVRSHDATLECDSGGRWVVWQACAPPGQVWEETAGPHIKIEWPVGSAAADRSDCIADAIQRMQSGCRPMTADESFVYDDTN